MVQTWDEIWNTSTPETKLDSSKMPLGAWCSHFLLIGISWYNAISHASGYLVVHGKDSNTAENPACERKKTSGRCKLWLFWILFLYEKNPDVVILKVKAFYQNATFLEILQSLLGREERLRACSHDYLQCCALQPVVIAPSVKARHLIRLYCSQAGESTKLLNTSHLSGSNIRTPTGSQTEFVSKHWEATDSLRYNRVSNSKPNWTKIPSHSS